MTDDATDFLDREARIVMEATALIKRVEPYEPYPKETKRGPVIGFLRHLNRKPLDPAVGETLLRQDLYGIAKLLRQRIWAMPGMDDARFGVLLYVGQLIGPEKLLQMQGLWDRLQRGDYEGAHDELLRSNWPALAGDDPLERERVLAQARQLRVGTGGVR